MTTCTHSAVSMLTDFFASDAIEAAARRTGFVKRTSKLTGKLFLALVTFGAWSDATTTLAQLAAKVPQLDEQVEVSPEAIHQRMNTRAMTGSLPTLARCISLIVQVLNSPTACTSSSPALGGVRRQPEPKSKPYGTIKTVYLVILR